MRTVLRPASGLLLARASYVRVVFVLLGAGLALALAVAAFTLLVPLAEAGAPPWTVVAIGVPLVGGPLLVGLIPGVRQVEGAAAQALLGVRFADGAPGPARTWSQRRRTLAWLSLHLAAGAILVAAVIGLIRLGRSVWTAPSAVVTLLVVVLAGRVLASWALPLLGPSSAERLERLEAEAAQATERNRVARELHDSIGHALSLVTVQAAAARTLLERDPAFASEALTTIETTARRAVSDLDHVLGLLRDEERGTDPVPALAGDSLDALVDAAAAAGLQVECTVSGNLSQLPVVVGREGYRIVQEGLTNALKYSADGTAALGVSLQSGRLAIRLSNPPRTATDAPDERTGRGLRGIGERARTLGGTMSAAEEGERWTLLVEIPADST